MLRIIDGGGGKNGIGFIWGEVGGGRVFKKSARAAGLFNSDPSKSGFTAGAVGCRMGTLVLRGPVPGSVESDRTVRTTATTFC